jgi:hypothetical protein
MITTSVLGSGREEQERSGKTESAEIAAKKI